MTTPVLSRQAPDDSWWTRTTAAPVRVPTVGLAGPLRIKVVIAGGFGVGKSTFVAAASEIPAATTEVPLLAALDPDDRAAVAAKVTTTAAVDVGRVTLAPHLALVLFGTCGQARFWFTFTEVCRGAAGAIVLVDARRRRLAGGFAYLDFIERCGLPYLVAVNEFDGEEHHRRATVRDALAIDPSVPVVTCDARSRASTRYVLAAFAEHVLGWQPPSAHGSPLATTYLATTCPGGSA